MGDLVNRNVEVGGTYVLEDQGVVMPDGAAMEVSDAFCESAAAGGDDDLMPIAACWDPAYLVLSFEDGVTPEVLGIERWADGWMGAGTLTFRVTDADSEPPTAVLVEFEPTY